MKNEERSDKHKRSGEVEACLKQLEQLLGPIGKLKQNEFVHASHPTIFIMGCARSGTTLVNQVLAKQLDCCYPSNFLSRFYYAPYIGALLQKLMSDLDFNGELLNNSPEIVLASVLGKTKGALSPNEFWYFWRKHFSFGEIQKLDEAAIDKNLAKEFANGLYSIQHVFDKPLLLKGMIMNWNIPYLEKLVESSCFIFVEREIKHNAQSLLLSRKEFFNDEQKWYSFLPEEYPQIKNASPEEQVVAQVAYTNKAIRTGLSQIPKEKQIHIQYADFCKNPDALIEEVSKKFSLARKKDTAMESLREGNEIKVDKAVWDKIVKFSANYSNS